MSVTLGQTMPPRLHVLHRPGMTFHVILRTGEQKKRKVSASFGWDWETDHIAVGQWLGGRIYPFECDLSPDGRWMYYNALNARWDDEATKGCFGALSRAPYLKAEKLWPVGNRWMSGSLIRRLKAGHNQKPDPSLPPDFAAQFDVSNGLYVARLQRDGWQKVRREKRPGAPDNHGKPCTYTTTTFRRPIVGAAWLERHHHVEPLGPRPFCYDTHTIVDVGGDRFERPGWQWAQVDADRGRLLWAEAGRLWAGRINRRGMPVEPRELFDFNRLRFQRKMAPY